MMSTKHHVNMVTSWRKLESVYLVQQDNLGRMSVLKSCKLYIQFNSKGQHPKFDQRRGDYLFTVAQH